jgi:eukaryotic-like serine/threonine-protein kinase
MTKLIGGRYEIIEELGRGTCGITFLAHDRHLPNDPIVVVKQLIIQSNSAPKILQKMKDYFQQEGELLQKIGGKDGIPALYAFFTEDNNFYLVQEYIPGSDLSARLNTGKSLTEMETIEILQGILTPLQIVHEYNIIHRDLKPANIRVRQRDDKIFLIDFGVAKQIQTNINPLTWQCGTPGYMPLEQIGGTPILSSDIYAVGIIGIQALAGLDPLNKDFPIANGKINPNSLKASPQLIDWLNKAISPNSNDRYVDATTALQSLNLVNAPTPTRREPPQTPKKLLNPIFWSLAVFTFVAIAIAIVSRKEQSPPFSPPPIDAEKWKTYQNAGIEFDYPPQWEVVPIGSVNDFQGSFTGDILEIHPVADPNKSCSERLLLNIKNAPRSKYTIDLYRQDTIDKIKGMNVGVKIADMTTPETKFVYRPAYRLSFQRKDRQCQTLQTLETGAIDRGKSYYLNYSFMPGDRDENRQRIFDRVVSSFKIQN